jgi:protoheme IX farnesyltransferase
MLTPVNGEAATDPALAQAAPRHARARPVAALGDYVTLLKPRIMLLIVITTVGAMAFAANGWPRTSLVLATVLGMVLATGGSSAINHWWDRDIDARMVRTRERPVPAGRVPASEALLLGLALGLGGVVELALAVNSLAATWAAAGFAIYVLVYTMWLKRRTPQNIVIGGAAGAVPPLVGWAAVTGSTTLAAVALFLIIFLWTPPHFWALGIILEDDYARAGVPMLPTVAGAAAASRQILVYTVLLVAASVVPVLTGDLGWAYLAAALLLGGRFLWLALQLLRDPERAAARRTFLYSLVYLAALFAAMGLDRALLS